MVMNTETVSSFSEACPEIASKIRNQLVRDAVLEDGFGRYSTMAKYSQTLPNESPLENDLNIVDVKTKDELMKLEAINWWASPCPSYHPLHTTGNQNVSRLCDAVSLAIWGIEDYSIKSILKKTLANDTKNGNRIANYFKNMATGNRGVSWETVVRAVDNDKLSLQSFHIFLVSNIIKRPIIVLGKGSICGIYLPTLGQTSQASKSPLVLGYLTGIVPLIPTQPDMGRDFIPICKANQDLLEVHCLSKDQISSTEAQVRGYMDVQHHSVMGTNGVLDIPVARLNLMSLTTDLCIIDSYFNGITASVDNVDALILFNRWGEISCGMSPDDWALPKQAAIYNFSYKTASIESQYSQPVSQQNLTVESDKENFFQRPTVELSSDVKLPKKAETGISSKRAHFKRKLTLSDMSQGFGMSRTLVPISNTEGPETQAMQKPVPVSGGPGAIRRIRRTSIPTTTSREEIEEEDEEEEEESGEVSGLVKRLSSSYKAQDEAGAHQHIGFVTDKSTVRAKNTILR